MPRNYEEYIPSLVDKTGGIVEQTINDYLNPPPSDPSTEPRDCINDIGFSHGSIDGRADFNEQVTGTFDGPTDPMQGYLDAYNACDGVAGPMPAPEIHIPSFDNPIVTGLEVALWPSELNVGEKEFLEEQQHQMEMPSVYHDAYDEGHTAGGIEAFDARLADHFDIGHSDPITPDPVPIDTPAAALDYNSHDSSFDSGSSWSSGGDFSGGGSDTSDGGSASSD